MIEMLSKVLSHNTTTLKAPNTQKQAYTTYIFHPSHVPPYPPSHRRNHNLTQSCLLHPLFSTDFTLAIFQESAHDLD